MSLTQKHRQLEITTALGADTLVINRMTVRERMNTPFEIEAELAAEDGKIDFNKVVGNNATIRLQQGENGTRYFNGFVSRLVQIGNQGRYARYRATIVPWFWFLTRTSDCRVFQRKSVVEIAEDVFNAHRFGSEYYEPRAKGPFPKRRFCVQYRETDFNFISRLLESEGIYYWFEHSNGKHKLILADGIGCSNPSKGYEEIEFHEHIQSGAEQEVVSDWLVEKQVQPVEYNLKDFDFKKPTEPLKAKHEMPQEYGMARFAVYDYPGEYFESSDADRYAKLRLEELQCRQELVRGTTNARGLAVGTVFTLKKHQREDQNRKYLITELDLNIDAGEFASGNNGGGFFSCSFTAIPATAAHRPARVTPKPIVQGVQTATVVGASGEEIHTDEFGRVKIKFHWDRYAKADDSDSCWVRVSHPAAGKGWGAIGIPRIGQEVVVDFLEGDPDRPIITGRVYNAENKVPYDLPANKTMTTFKSNSSKGGEGFNELRFEDKKGDEQIFMHGEKNLDIRIKKDAFEFIGNDRHLIVKKDQIEKVENNRDETVDADHKEKIGKDRHLKVVGKEAKEVGKSLSLTVKGDVIEVFKENHSEQTTKDYYLKAENIVIEGMTNVTIKVGQSYIAIEASGIKIGATKIELEAQAEASIKGNAGVKIESSAMLEAKSPMTTVKGDGMLTLKGGMVMIN